MRNFFYLFAIAAVMLGMASCGDGNNPDQPEQLTPGALKGKFSVAPGKQVRFSQGNLQYCPSQDVWLFAKQQWNFVGGGEVPGNVNHPTNPSKKSDNTQISPDYDGLIDLFGWGTGNNPTLATDQSSDYQTFTDWGTNPINNGGNKANLWRTLTKDEWEYLFHKRTNAEKLFGLGTINGAVTGVIILPDNWTLPDGVTFTPSTNKGLEWNWNATRYDNIYRDNFTHNAFTETEWLDQMQPAGAVFLPAAGHRNNTNVSEVSLSGYYCSATPSDASTVYKFDFNSYQLRWQYINYRFWGRSVRLVQDIN